MNKFAFKSNAEKSLVLAAVKTRTPAEFYSAFSRYAIGLETLPGTQAPAVEERMQQLREMLQDFLYEVGLGQNRQAMSWAEQVVESIRPDLEGSLAGQGDLWDQLSGTRYVDKSAPPVNPGPGQVQQDDIGDVYHTRGPVAPPKPQTMPKDLKISPGKQKPLYRQNPGVNAEADRGLEKIAMPNDAAYDKLINSMLEIADMADEAGLYPEADKVAAVLPAIRTVKLAQYEGFQNYWIANGRAFEMAYKQKRMKGKSDPADFRSAHEVWFEVLDEYQKSLMTNQADFISKYARRDSSVLDRAAQEILLSSITSRVEAGASPGVAFYEAVEELSNGEHADIVAKQLRETLTIIASAAEKSGKENIVEQAKRLMKEAGWFDNLSRNVVQKFWDKDYQKPTTAIVDRLDQQRSVVPALTQLWHKVDAAGKAGNAVPLYELSEIIAPLEGDLIEYSNRLKLTKMPETKSATLPHPESVKGGAGDVIDPAKFGQYVNLMANFFKYVNPTIAKRIDDVIYRGRAKGLVAPAEAYMDTPPAPPPQPTPAKMDVATAKTQANDWFNKLHPDEKWELSGKLYYVINQWINSPEGIKLIGTKGNPPVSP